MQLICPRDTLMALFQAGYMSPSGKAEFGILTIENRPKAVTVTLITEGLRPQRLGTFSHNQWLDQDNVNKELRGKGLLWRRTQTESHYAQRRATTST